MVSIVRKKITGRKVDDDVKFNPTHIGYKPWEQLSFGHPWEFSATGRVI